MNNTIPQPVPTRAIRQDDLMSFVNFDLLPFVNQVRASLNNQFRFSVNIGTAHTGVFTTVFISAPMPTNSAWHITVKSVAVEQNAVPGGSAIFAYALAVRAQGDAVIIGTNLVTAITSGPPYQIQVINSGPSVVVQVKDGGISNTTWFVYFEILEAK